MTFPSSLVERFQLLRELEVSKGFERFQVLDRETRDRGYLIRLLPPPFSQDRAVVDEFHQFFSRFTQITRNAHILTVYSFSGVAGTLVYVLEEFTPGICLPDFIQRNRESQDFLKSLHDPLTRACEALHFAHQKGIFHLCIAPEDILINEDNPRLVKLVGFGTQIFAASKRLDAIPEDSRLCMAPEVLAGKEPQPSSDIYSLALALKAVVPELFGRGSILSKALSKNPSGRPSRARDFGYGLKEMLETKKVSVGWEKTSVKTPGGLQPLLTIMTEPLGADVKLDGRLLGTTSPSGISVSWKQGSIIEVQKPGFQPETLNLASHPAESEITVKLKSALRLWTNPWGASVLVDGKPFGATTKEGLVIPWDGVRIEIEKPGYGREQLSFDGPPTSPETVLELYPVMTSATQKKHPLELAGYIVGAIALLFLPLVYVVGFQTHPGGEAKLIEKDKELANLKGVIEQKNIQWKSALQTIDEREKKATALDTANAKLKEDLDQKERDIAYLKQSAQGKKEESERALAKLQGDLKSEKTLKESEQQKVLEKDKQIARLNTNLDAERKETANLRRVEGEKERLEKEVAQLRGSPSYSPTTIRLARGDPSLNNALLKAVEGGDYRSVEDLLKKGAEANVRNSFFLTPLMIAVREGHVAIAKVLLEYGADINATTNIGTKVEDLIRRWGERNQAEISTLLKSYSNPSSPVPQRRASNDNLDGELIAASTKGDLLAVRQAIYSGADVNCKSHVGLTPLMRASARGHVFVVQYLLHNGADISAVDRAGWTAEDFAKQLSNKEVLNLLQNHRKRLFSRP